MYKFHFCHFVPRYKHLLCSTSALLHSQQCVHLCHINHIIITFHFVHVHGVYKLKYPDAFTQYNARVVLCIGEQNSVHTLTAGFLFEISPLHPLDSWSPFCRVSTKRIDFDCVSWGVSSSFFPSFTRLHGENEISNPEANPQQRY